MKKKNSIKAAHIITAICLLTAGTLLYHLFSTIFSDFEFGNISGQSTKLAFQIDNPSVIGFNRDVTVYTENGITSAAFSGKITVDGTAEIIVTANEDGSIVYGESYSDLNAETIDFVVDNLTPYSYYTLSFVSDNAKKGDLLLITNESLVERPERPARSEHTPPRYH